MAAESMQEAGEHALTPASYIGHHLTFLNVTVAGHVIHLDTLLVSILLGFVIVGFLRWVVAGASPGVPSGRQAVVEWIVEFVNDQVKGIFNKDISFVAPVALTVFLWVIALNAMDFLPVDIMGKFVLAPAGAEKFRMVPTADINTTFALALSVWLLMIFFSIKAKGLGGFAHELVAAPFGMPKLSWNPISWVLVLLAALANFLFQMIEYVSKPLSHSLRLFGNMYAGEIIFLLLWMWASTGVVGTIFGSILGLGWALFHILIVLLQAFIFMMLTVVYIAMAHEHH
jgi:F-type H+-transporting ATPase subunit a